MGNVPNYLTPANSESYASKYNWRWIDHRQIFWINGWSTSSIILLEILKMEIFLIFVKKFHLSLLIIFGTVFWISFFMICLGWITVKYFGSMHGKLLPSLFWSYFALFFEFRFLFRIYTYGHLAQLKFILCETIAI